MQTHALRIRLHHCFYPTNGLFQFAKSIERQCLCLPQKHRTIYLKSTERFTSKTPINLHQKTRFSCRLHKFALSLLADKKTFSLSQMSKINLDCAFYYNENVHN